MLACQTQAVCRRRSAACATKLTANTEGSEPSIYDVGPSSDASLDEAAEQFESIDCPSPLLKDLSKYVFKDVVHYESDAREVPSSPQRSPCCIASETEEFAKLLSAKRKVTKEGQLSWERKPTRLQKPSVSIKRLRLAVPEVIPLPKAAQPLPPKSRRKNEMRPSSIVEEVMKRPTKSSRDLAKELTEKYSLDPRESRAKVNQVHLVRQAQKAFVTDIRANLRMDADNDERLRFLIWLEDHCRTIEGYSSDEIV